jgi:hypothetical protein
MVKFTRSEDAKKKAKIWKANEGMNIYFPNVL